MLPHSLRFSVHCLEVVTSTDVLADQLDRNRSSMLMSCTQRSLPQKPPQRFCAQVIVILPFKTRRVGGLEMVALVLKGFKGSVRDTMSAVRLLEMKLRASRR